MNVAISAQGTDWNAPVETHFGRARYLLIVAQAIEAFQADQLLEAT